MPEVSPSPSRDPEQDKRLLFGALTNVFARMSQHGPLLIVLEDLLWSDDTSPESPVQQWLPAVGLLQSPERGAKVADSRLRARPGDLHDGESVPVEPIENPFNQYWLATK